VWSLVSAESLRRVPSECVVKELNPYFLTADEKPGTQDFATFRFSSFGLRLFRDPHASVLTISVGYATSCHSSIRRSNSGLSVAYATKVIWSWLHSHARSVPPLRLWRNSNASPQVNVPAHGSFLPSRKDSFATEHGIGGIILVSAYSMCYLSRVLFKYLGLRSGARRYDLLETRLRLQEHITSYLVVVYCSYVAYRLRTHATMGV